MCANQYYKCYSPIICMTISQYRVFWPQNSSHKVGPGAYLELDLMCRELRKSGFLGMYGSTIHICNFYESYKNGVIN